MESANVRNGSIAATGRNGWKTDIDPQALMSNPAPMLRAILGLSVLCAACGAVEQPKSAKTVAAYEVPLPTPTDRRRFVALLERHAEAAGFHVDAATDKELKGKSEIYRQTMNATVWRGEDDEESIASAMDFEEALGRVWISFSLGDDPPRSRQFREALMPAIKRDWPDTASLPIMPNGAIPLPATWFAPQMAT